MLRTDDQRQREKERERARERDTEGRRVHCNGNVSSSEVGLFVTTVSEEGNIIEKEVEEGGRRRR